MLNLKVMPSHDGAGAVLLAGCRAVADVRCGLCRPLQAFTCCYLSCWLACKCIVLRQACLTAVLAVLSSSPAVCLQVAELTTLPYVTGAGPLGHGMAAMHLCTPLLSDLQVVEL